MRRVCSVVVLLIVGQAVQAQTPALADQAREWTAKNSDAPTRLGLAEILRVSGDKKASLDELRKIAAGAPDDASLQELLCWRMLPATPSRRDVLVAELAKLKTIAPGSRWLPIFELALLAGESDRTLFRERAFKNLRLPAVGEGRGDRERADLPPRFPGGAAEKAHQALLVRLGHGRVRAGMDIVAARDFGALHALRDLDRALTREAGFCKEIERQADAERLLAVRNRLRQSYLASSRHLVERLFALTLNGDVKERDALLSRANKLPWLRDRAKFAQRLEQLGEERAWKVVERLLESEVAFIDNPPALLQQLPDAIAEVEISAKSKKVADATVHYEGDVRIQLGVHTITCQKLTVVNHAKPESLLLNGEGNVRIVGLSNFPKGIEADRFTYQADSGAYSLGGDVKLGSRKLRSCTIERNGDVLHARSWLDDFRNALTIDAKRRLLPEIQRVFEDDELPDEVRFLSALERLSTHLSWRAPYLPPVPERLELHDRIRKHKRDQLHFGPWQEAFGGEPWMLREIPDKDVNAFREELRAWYQRYHERVVKGDPNVKLPELGIPERDFYFWRLRDPRAAEVERCLRLLTGIRDNELRAKADRWAKEIRRNNTVLTFDIAAAASAGKAHSLLMDVRNAEQVAFKLYRVRRPQELLFATKNIGVDFIYRDHGLDGRKKAIEDLIKQIQSIGRNMGDVRISSGPEFKPEWSKEQLVHAWQVRVADLTHHPSNHFSRWERWHRGDRDDEPDAHYFDDECSEHAERLEKSYRPDPDDQLSSWQCDRVVKIPEKLLQEGAYVLVAEANGQAAHVPILVDPLSLTLRRCRDGVFVVASDADGAKPLADAQVFARGLKETATTDHEGVAFARVLAFGDQAVLVHHQGQYAIGGFGRVFDGIYDTPYSRELRADRLLRDRKAVAKEASAQLYADRHVIVAYTDRPTYRPGHDVKFKLIVRKLEIEKLAGAATTFRSQEFDAATKMVLPDLNQAIRYEVVDPKGHEIARGTMQLSDFGTAAGEFKLNDEVPPGAYALRVRIAGTPRLVPEVFAVKHYRRPNFEISVAGIPEKLAKLESIGVTVSGRYFFGSPVTKGNAEVRAMRKDASKPIAEDHVRLNETGEAKFKVELPRNLQSGKYFVVASITDSSGRTESVTRPMIVETPDGLATSGGLSGLPRFIAVQEVYAFKTSAKSIRAERKLGDVLNVVNIVAKDGIATLKFDEPGWYRLKAGDDESELFVYGGQEHPEFQPHGHVAHRQRPSWVNLSDFAYQEHHHRSRFEVRSENLWALLDQQSLKIGDKLRLLVYVPHRDARVLFTFEGRTIFDYAVVSLVGKVGPFHVIELPIKDRYFPNVYIQGRILPRTGEHVLEQDLQKRARELDKQEVDEDFDPRWCRIDVAKPAEKMRAPLNVRVETDREAYRPGDSVRATIKVTDHQGNPKAAELSLAAVDESVFTFGEDNLDALPAFFSMPHESRRLLPKVWRVSRGKQANDALVRDLQKMLQEQRMVSAIDKMVESASETIPDLRDAQLTAMPLPRLGGEMPAGQIPLTRLRQHFQETATWLPQLRTDDNGTARAIFTLPDSLTRYRLTSLAVTKSSDVGVGRTRITASLPLAVQVFVPRFAVEKDRLQAVALVHNHTGKERICAFAWQIDGAATEEAQTGKVTVPANGSAKVGLWLTLDKIGTARIQFRASAGGDSDAEVRLLPIQPLGKPAEVNANQALAPQRMQAAEKQLAGAFIKDGIIKLPAGFVTQEMRLSLATSDLAQALDGLDYLIDYPHGCIEQTMSRFMPAVMVKHATQKSPVVLQPEIAKKLPDVLDKGLTRVYSHQHADGSWGWFEKDSRNLPMSIYVVYGLARCQATGTKVDAAVLQRGCDYLRNELNTNPDLSQTSRAWLAMALAGHVDEKTLEKLTLEEAKQKHADRPLVWCNLALACRAAGLNEAGERLWAKVHQHLRHSWWGHDTESFALILNTQIAFGAPYNECRTMTNRLLGNRNGTQWQHTRDTAHAIEALSDMLAYAQKNAQIRRLEVKVGNKTILDVRDADLKKLVHRIHLKGDALPAQEALELHLKADADEPIHVALHATGVQRLDEVPAAGSRVQLTRTLEALDGNKLTGAPKVGQVVRVRLRLQLAEREEYLMIDERRPALCEFAASHLEGPAADLAVHHDWHDDRLCVFFASLPAGIHEVVYYLRAETPGRCTVLPGMAYPMYNDRERGTTASLKLSVLDK